MRPIETILEDKENSRLLLTAFQKILDTTPAMVFVKDMNLTYHAATDSFVRMLGKEKPEEVIGRSDFDVFASADLARRYRADDRRLLASEEDLVDFLEPLPDENGQARYSSTSKYILRDARGQKIGLVGVSRDVTREVLAEQHHQKELEYLFRLPENTYLAAFLDVSVWRVVSERRQSIQGRIFEVHESMDSFLHRAHENVADCRGPATTFYRDFSLKTMQEIFESGQREVSMEYLRRMPNGESHWVRDQIKLLINPSDGHLCVMILVRDIDDKKKEEQELLWRAERDELTGLLNRSSIKLYVRRVLEQSQDGSAHALLIIDADNFKRVNDTYGHQTGDAFLKKLAEAIQKSFRSNDLVGRIGGDELVVLMRDVPTRAMVAEKVEELRRQLQEACRAYSGLGVSCSIGVSRYPHDGRTLEELYFRSDEALYRAKTAGKNGVCFAEDIRDLV